MKEMDTDTKKEFFLFNRSAFALKLEKKNHKMNYTFNKKMLYEMEYTLFKLIVHTKMCYVINFLKSFFK